MGSAHPNLVPYRAFKASDGWFVIGVGSDNQWQKLVKALNIDSKKEWDTNSGRIEFRDEVENAIGKIVIGMKRKGLENLLDGIPCAPVNTISEAINDPQSIARNLIVNHKGVNVIASPLRFIDP